jgi:hypothetical protein
MVSGRTIFESTSILGVITLEAWRESPKSNFAPESAHIGVTISQKGWFGPKRSYSFLDLSPEQVELLVNALKPRAAEHHLS